MMLSSLEHKLLTHIQSKLSIWTRIFLLYVLFFELVIIIWPIQVKDGKLLDEMAVSMTGLANKVGLAEVCHSVQRQNQFPLSASG